MVVIPTRSRSVSLMLLMTLLATTTTAGAAPVSIDTFSPSSTGVASGASTQGQANPQQSTAISRIQSASVEANSARPTRAITHKSEKGHAKPHSGEVESHSTKSHSTHTHSSYTHSSHIHLPTASPRIHEYHHKIAGGKTIVSDPVPGSAWAKIRVILLVPLCFLTVLTFFAGVGLYVAATWGRGEGWFGRPVPSAQEEEMEALKAQEATLGAADATAIESLEQEVQNQENEKNAAKQLQQRRESLAPLDKFHLTVPVVERQRRESLLSLDTFQFGLPALVNRRTSTVSPRASIASLPSPSPTSTSFGVVPPSPTTRVSLGAPASPASPTFAPPSSADARIHPAPPSPHRTRRPSPINLDIDLARFPFRRRSVIPPRAKRS